MRCANWFWQPGLRQCLYKSTVSTQGLPEQPLNVMMMEFVLLSNMGWVMFRIKCFTESLIRLWKNVDSGTW